MSINKGISIVCLSYLTYNLQYRSVTRFRRITIIFSILGDLLIVTYLWLTFSNRSFLEKTAKLAAKSQGLEHLDPQYLEEIILVALKSLKLMLVMMALYHLFIYASHFYQKTYAKIYIISYVFVAAIGCSLATFSYLFSGNILWAILFLIASIMYGYLSMGFIKKYE